MGNSSEETCLVMMVAPPLSGHVMWSERSLTLLCLRFSICKPHRVVIKTKRVHTYSVRTERGTT